MIKKLKKEQLLIGALVGILLLVIAIPVPEKEKQEQVIVKEQVLESKGKEMETALEEILQTISGVGKVKVFITYKDYGKVIVEKDEAVSEELIQEADGSGGTRTTTTVQKERQTVYGMGEEPYIIQEVSPTIEGVLVVARGAGNVSVKKQIQETLVALFGLDAHKISIMKMEVPK